MAGIQDSQDDEVIATINMVPFIDICLVLLIIFMVTSTTIARSAIEVDLPTAANAETVAPSTLGIVITADERIELNGEPIAVEDLVASVRREVAADPSVQAIIAGDQVVDYGRVVHVVDLVREGGVGSFALNITPVAEPQGRP